MLPKKKEKADLLIDYLSNKELSFGCFIDDNESFGSHRFIEISDTGLYRAIASSGEIHLCSPASFKVIGHPVMIGDVLKGIAKEKSGILYRSLTEIGQAWQPLGFTKSLNEIFREFESPNSLGKIIEAKALLDFLWGLFGEEITDNQTK